MTLELFHALVTTLVLIGVFALFIKEKLPPHITAMSGMAILLVTGAISTDDALKVFSNSAPITIACMFILSAALERTGVIDSIGHAVMNAVGKNKIVTVLSMLFGVMVVSAFVNNTPVVVLMVPVVIAVAKKLNDFPSKHLIPLSYAAILGGSCTMIGTSTNILVDGVARASGQSAFSMFEITVPGMIMAAVGALFLATIGRHLLPERVLLENELIDESTRKRFIAEALIPYGSPLIGKTLNSVQFTEQEGYEVIDLVRQDTGTRAGGISGFLARVKGVLEEATDSQGRNKARSTLRDIPLQAGDRLVFKTDKDELLTIKNQLGITFNTEDAHVSEPMSARETHIIEGVVGLHSPFIGKKSSDLRLRRRYGCYILAIHRDKQNITGNFEDVVLRYGDVLLMEGPKEELDRLCDNEDILSITQVKRRAFDKKKAPIAILAISAVVVLSAIEVMPIAGLAMVGAMLVIVMGCIKPEKAYEAIEWRILMLIFGMLALSVAMEDTGIAKLIVNAVAGLVQDFGPYAVLIIIYSLTSLLTEVMSNNATAVLLTPIAIGLADSMGVDPRPFIVAVMFGASASFATPIGYQTNTYVYNAGNYRFADFLKIGVPMNILMLITAMIVIPLFWSF